MKSSVIILLSTIAAVLVIGVAVVFLRPTEEVKLPILVEEYFDYNCIHCKTFEDTAKKIKSDFGTDIEFKKIQSPILGSSSLQATYAVEAAKEQNKYEEYHTLLFANFEKRTDADFESFAKELKLDVKKFNADRESEKIQNRVSEQLAANKKNNVSSTPTIFVNGRRVANIEYEVLKSLIAEKIDTAKKAAKK
jgi:protein-disulfide isomerase